MSDDTSLDVNTTEVRKLRSSPAWVDEIIKKYSSGQAHAFMLSFNVSDYIDDTNLLEGYFFQMFSKFDVVCSYNRATGISFPTETYKNKAIDILGLDQQTSPIAANPYAGALGSVDQLDREDISIPQDGPVESLNTLWNLLRNPIPDADRRAKTFVIINYVETLVPAGASTLMPPQDRDCLIMLLEMARSEIVSKAGGVIFLVTSNPFNVHSDIRATSSRIAHIQIPLPDYNRRKRYITNLREERRDNETAEVISPALKLSPGFNEEHFASITAGLSLYNIEDIKLRADLEENIVTPALAMNRKKEIVQQEYGDIIAMPPLDFTYEDLGGFKQMKSHFKDLVIPQLRGRDSKFCPKGVLLLGPPGTGKSVFVKATAAEADVNYIEINMGRLRGMFVGMSEALLEKAITAILANAPTLVFIDEVDQSINMSRSSGGDSGVSANQFSRLMQVMADPSNRGSVLWMFASNRPDLIDAAFMREGRVDLLIPFLAPDSDEERIEVLQAVARRYKYPLNMEEGGWNEIAIRVGGYTQAQIEAVSRKAFEVAYIENRKQTIITQAHYLRAVNRLKPNTGEVTLMTNMALMFANDLDLIPQSMRRKWESKDSLADETKALEEKYGSRRGRRSI